MKKITFLVALVIITISNLFGQNWNLIKQNERYHFTKNGDTIPLYTVFIDSFTVMSFDTTFYFNRLFLPCDTCSSDGFYLDNQPVFFQREWHKSGSGLSTLIDPETIFIQVTGTVGDSWWMDELKTKLARVDSREIESFLNITDSVLTISVNNEEYIKISKNYGVIKFGDHQLSGLEKANLGNCLLKFEDIYDFKVGDVFQYQESVFYPETDYYGGLYKWEIKEIIRDEDTLTLKIDEKFRPHYYPFDGNCTHNQIIKRIENVPNHMVNQYPFQKITIYPGTFDEILTEEQAPDDYICYGFASVSIKENKLVKNVGFYFEENGPIVENEPGIFSISNIVDFYPSCWFWQYQQGLGLVLKELFHFEVTYSWYMIGYIKDEITTGTVFSDGFMTDKFDNKMNEVVLYPNPASDRIIIEGLNDNETEIQIFNMEGILISRSLRT